jgi:hypothetical protein
MLIHYHFGRLVIVDNNTEENTNDFSLLDHNFSTSIPVMEIFLSRFIVLE